MTNTLKEQRKKLDAKLEKGKPILRWVGYAVAGALFLLVLGLALWKRNQRLRELAKLRTKVQQDEVRKAQLEHEATVSKELAKVKALAAEANELNHQIDLQNQAVRDTEAKLKEELAAIDEVTSWKLLDEYNRSGR